MGGINSLSGLNSVPVDYRPPAAPEPGAQPQQAAPEAQAPQRPPRASNVVQKLDVLLLGGAGRSIAADAVGTQAKTVGDALVQAHVITAKEAAKLQELAKKAASTLKALDAFSGADLAKALVPEKADSKVLVWRTGLFSSNAAAKAATAAIKAQQELSEELAKFNGRLAANDNVDAKLQDAFTELQFQADRRSTEILSIAARMYDLALQAAAAGPGGDPKMKALLSATFSELMPREAILMHGTAEALELMNKHMADKMRPLAEKLDALQARGGAILSNEDIVALESDMRTMKEALADVRNNGLKVEDGHLEVDKSLLDGMEKTLDAAWDTIQNARADMAHKARKEFVGEVIENLSIGQTPEEKALAAKLAASNRLISRFVKARAELQAELDSFANGKFPLDQVEARIGEKIKKIQDIDIFKEDLVAIGFSAGSAKSVCDHIDGLRLVKAQFKEMLARTDAFAKGGADGATAGSDVLRIFLGERSLSSVVDAKIRGFNPDDVDPATDDSNIVSSKRLGGGEAGSAYLVTTKDGTEYVFKPELEGRLGLDHLVLAQGGAFADTQTVARLNLATQDVAKKLGCDDVIVKYSVGNHNGQFGIFMEKAKGATGQQFSDNEAVGDEGLLKPSEFKTALLDKAENNRLRGEVARKLCKLQWLDLVTGQMDRHWDNYFVGISRDQPRKVSVKGIDCDASFPAYRVGLQKYALDKDLAKEFFDNLLGICKELHPSKQGQGEYDNRCSKDPAIVRNADGSITVDLTKCKSPEVAMALLPVVGAQSFALPEVIDQETYDKLVELDEDPAKKEAFVQSLAPRLSPEALAATRTRLDEAIAHAKALKEKNKVIAAGDWSNPDTVRNLAKLRKSVTLPSTQRQGIHKASRDSRHVSNFLIRICPSYFRRDYMGDSIPW